MTQILRKRLAVPFPTVKSPLYLTKTCQVINCVLHSTTGMSTLCLKRKGKESSLIQIVTIMTLNTIFNVVRQNIVASRVSPVHCFPFYSLLLSRVNFPIMYYRRGPHRDRSIAETIGLIIFFIVFGPTSDPLLATSTGSPIASS